LDLAEGQSDRIATAGRLETVTDQDLLTASAVDLKFFLDPKPFQEKRHGLTAYSDSSSLEFE